MDTGIVHPTEFDFLLTRCCCVFSILHANVIALPHSHSGLKGTSKASHYHRVYDDANLSPDDLEQLSFALCHVYARCTRSVSIPAPGRLLASP